MPVSYPIVSHVPHVVVCSGEWCKIGRNDTAQRASNDSNRLQNQQFERYTNIRADGDECCLRNMITNRQRISTRVCEESQSFTAETGR